MLKKTAALCLGLGLCFGFLFVSCAGGEPKPECEFNSDCSSKAQKCTSGKCTDIKCTTNDDCRGGWYCNPSSAKCQATPAVECQADSDCKNSEKCELDGKCVPKPECESNSDCKDTAKPECKGGKCQEKSCTADTDCGDKEECKDSKCQEKPVECTTNTDCKDAIRTECNSENKCVEPTCSTDADCKDTNRSLCLGGKCVEDSGKDVGEACERGKVRCKSKFLCYQKDPQDPKGVCSPPCTPTSPSCESGKVCKPTTALQEGGVCVDKTGGKALGEECDDQNPCEVDMDCREWKGKKVCQRPCDPAKQDCGTKNECYTFKGKEEKNYCVSRREPCGIGRPCDNDYLCEQGFCNPPPSCENITCKEYEVCDKGACREVRCPDELSCPTNSTCDPTGRCQYSRVDPGCVSCDQANPCSSGDLCLNGFGGGGSSQAFCFPQNCTVGQPCTNPNFTCRPINITLNSVTCTADTDCTRQFPGFAWTCNNGTCSTTPNLCVPTIGQCTNQCKNVTCQGRDVCVPTDGSCVTPYKKACTACKHSEECGGADDLCVNFSGSDTGQSYCATDCSKSSCPPGQECLSVGSSRQCIPISRKCP
ncbi:MAG: hypothetical protein EP343_12730 [Deltaproteobacteria bacterium]|nr:MAG: hypothetical protein EP343_12730 [Deltaproteobacteria bacterium]